MAPYSVSANTSRCLWFLCPSCRSSRFSMSESDTMMSIIASLFAPRNLIRIYSFSVVYFNVTITSSINAIQFSVPWISESTLLSVMRIDKKYIWYLVTPWRIRGFRQAHRRKKAKFVDFRLKPIYTSVTAAFKKNDAELRWGQKWLENRQLVLLTLILDTHFNNS
jgi:hypothetical protein